MTTTKALGAGCAACVRIRRPNMRGTMSFSFSYAADTPAAAKALLASHPEAPDSVKSFIVELLAGIEEALGDVPVTSPHPATSALARAAAPTARRRSTSRLRRRARLLATSKGKPLPGHRPEKGLCTSYPQRWIRELECSVISAFDCGRNLAPANAGRGALLLTLASCRRSSRRTSTVMLRANEEAAQRVRHLARLYRAQQADFAGNRRGARP